MNVLCIIYYIMCPSFIYESIYVLSISILHPSYLLIQSSIFLCIPPIIYLYLSVCTSIHPFYLSIYSCLYIFFRLSISLFIYLHPLILSTYSFYLSVYSIYVSVICLSIYLSLKDVWNGRPNHNIHRYIVILHKIKSQKVY